MKRNTRRGRPGLAAFVAAAAALGCARGEPAAFAPAPDVRGVAPERARLDLSAAPDVQEAREAPGFDPGFDPGYIRPTTGSYSLRLFGGKRDVGFDVDRDGNLFTTSGDYVDFAPNVGFSFGFELDWKGSSFGYTGSPGEPSRDVAEYGRSRIDDVSWSRYGRAYAVEVYWHSYRGLYHEHRDDEGALVEVVRRDDLAVTGFGCDVYYTLDHERFSLRAAYRGDERQLRDAGSVVFVGSAHGYEVRGDGPLLPAYVQAAYGDLGLLEGFSSVGAGGGIGYAYTWVRAAKGGEMRYLLLSCLYGVGLGGYRIDGGASDGSGLALEQNACVMVAGGAYLDTVQAGLTALARADSLVVEGVDLGVERLEFAAFVAYHF